MPDIETYFDVTVSFAKWSSVLLFLIMYLNEMLTIKLPLLALDNRGASFLAVSLFSGIFFLAKVYETTRKGDYTFAVSDEQRVDTWLNHRYIDAAFTLALLWVVWFAAYNGAQLAFQTGSMLGIAVYMAAGLLMAGVAGAMALATALTYRNKARARDA